MKALAFSENFVLAMLQICNRLDSLRDGLDNLRKDLDHIQEYMTSLATHKVTPNLISPYDLRKILSDVEEKLKANPRLTLPTSQQTDIWSYYQFLKIEAFVQSDMLIVILVLPLIDKDLQFDLFRAHNLPLLHPSLRKVFTYEIESPYIALRNDGNYLTIPTHDDILTCTISAGHFCNLNTPLYPTSTTSYCVYHLLVNNLENIEQHCKMNIEEYTQDSAVNLNQNIWALSSIKPTTLHVTCLTYSYEIEITSSFQIVELDNSCQAYNPNIILPSGNEMKETNERNLIEARFFNYELNYTSISNFFLTNTFNLTKLTPTELDALANDLPPLKQVSMKNISALMVPIDKNYPFTMPIYGYVLLTIGGTIVVILVLGVFYYMKYKRAKAAAKNSPIMRYKNRKTPARLPSKDEIELQLPSLTSTNERVSTNNLQTARSKSPATPLLVKKTLEQNYNIDFSAYEKKRKQQRLDSIV
jgi:hypothetical protein